MPYTKNAKKSNSQYTDEIVHLGDLAEHNIWIPWKLIPGKDGNLRKVPLDPRTGRPCDGSSHEHTVTCEKARAAASKYKASIGVVLGPIPGADGFCLGGCDLDTCLSPTGLAAPWALEILNRLRTYSEISPSGTDVKAFFLYRRKPSCIDGVAKSVKRKGDAHPPGIELYLAKRWFAVTEKEYPGPVGADPLREVSSCDLGWLIEDAMPRFVGKEAGEHTRDESGSGEAFRYAVHLQLDGRSIEDFEEWATEHPWSDYEKNPDKAIERTWNNAAKRAGEIALRDRNGDFDDLTTTDPMPEDKGTPSSAFLVVRGDEVRMVPIDWIWPNRLARGKIVIWAGFPGGGKSTISLDSAARITTGAPWPDGGRAPKGSVIVLSSEDGLEDTAMPRFVAAGGDPHKIYFVRSVLDGKRASKKRRAFSLQTDLANLSKLIAEIGDVVLVILDPITSYMGDKVDSHQTASVRAVLDPLAEWTDRERVAVLAISHPPKAVQAKAINAVTGSLAYVGVSRLVFCMIEDPETKGRYLWLWVKGNIGAGWRTPGMGYTIENADLEAGVTAGRVVWDGAAVTMTADQAMAAEREKDRKPSQEAEAIAWLDNILGFGPATQEEVKSAAEQEFIAFRTLERAAKKLGVIKRKSKEHGGVWTWKLAQK